MRWIWEFKYIVMLMIVIYVSLGFVVELIRIKILGGVWNIIISRRGFLRESILGSVRGV